MRTKRYLFALLFAFAPCFGQGYTIPATTAGQCGAAGFLPCDVSASILPLPTGAATATNQTTVQAPVAPATATATKSVLVGGQYNSGGVTLTNGQQASAQLTSDGRVLVGLSSAGAVAPGTAGTKSDLVGGVYTAAGVTLTDGQQSAMQFGSDGRLLVTLGSAGPVAPGTAGTKSNLSGCVYTAGGVAPTTGQQVAAQCDAGGNLQVNVGHDWFHAQAVMGAAASHANNTCLGAIQSMIVTEAVASKGILLNNLSVRTADGHTGAIGVWIFSAAPASLCVADGDAFAMTDANLLLVPPGANFTITPAAMAGGITQAGAAQTNIAMSMPVDAAKKFWIALVNVSGGAVTPAANSLAFQANGFADPN